MPIIQEYTAVFPVVRLFRRLLTDGVPIADMQAKIDSMRESGDVKFPNPRQQLPERWVLVELPIDTPHGRKLMIVTGSWWRPVDIDPLSILCCERLVPPKIMYAPGEPRLDDQSDAGSTETKRQQGTLEPDITEWLLKDMTRPTTAGKQALSAGVGLYRDECEKQFPGAGYLELKRALLVARERLGLVKPRIPSKRARPERQPKQS